MIQKHKIIIKRKVIIGHNIYIRIPNLHPDYLCEGCPCLKLIEGHNGDCLGNMKECSEITPMSWKGKFRYIRC